MRKYYYLNLNQQSNGDYEVHSEGCTFMPTSNRDYLGTFENCKEAVSKAKNMHPYKSKINGCFYCCRDCHTS